MSNKQYCVLYLSTFRWQNWVIRGFMSLVLLLGFLLLLYLGPVALVFVVCHVFH